MEQTLFLGGLAVLTVISFALYPRLMFGLVGALLRGLYGIVVDGVALLLTWI